MRVITDVITDQFDHAASLKPIFMFNLLLNVLKSELIKAEKQSICLLLRRPQRAHEVNICHILNSYHIAYMHTDIFGHQFLTLRESLNCSSSRVRSSGHVNRPPHKTDFQVSNRHTIANQCTQNGSPVKGS